jgi:Zn-dependent alcohol dehydrogenase
MSARAIVSYEPVEGVPNWKLEDVTLRPLQSNELLIRLVATGICHTDLIFGAAPVEMGGLYPKVLGHEGNLLSLSPLCLILTDMMGRKVLVTSRR